MEEEEEEVGGRRSEVASVVLLFVLKGRFIPARGETPGTIYKDLRVLKGRFILQEAGILLNVESPATLGSFDLRL